MKRRFEQTLVDSLERDPAVFARVQAALVAAGYDDTDVDATGAILMIVRHAIAALLAGAVR
jgi:hypothetical protein